MYPGLPILFWCRFESRIKEIKFGESFWICLSHVRAWGFCGITKSYSFEHLSYLYMISGIVRSSVSVIQSDININVNICIMTHWQCLISCYSIYVGQCEARWIEPTIYELLAKLILRYGRWSFPWTHYNSGMFVKSLAKQYRKNNTIIVACCVSFEIYIPHMDSCTHVIMILTTVMLDQ